MSKTRIDWENPIEGWKLTHTWNPLIGCKHGCAWCIAKQWNIQYKFIDDWEQPEYSPKRAEGIKTFPKNSVVFVCFMADLFGDWVRGDTIQGIINYTTYYPDMKFLYLTKNPKRYLDFEFPENSWIGTSISTSAELNRAGHLIYAGDRLKLSVFLSIEPMLGSFKGYSFSLIDWIIIGGMTANKEMRIDPKKEWIYSVKHNNIYYKNNLRGIMEE
jgi:protein gp37